MSSLRFLLESLVYYWRTNLAVLLGVLAGTAVIGGALIVGDSVRGSLRKMSLERLGQIDHALSSYRFFRERLVDELSADGRFQERFSAAAPALLMQGSLQRETGTATRRVNEVNVYGIDERLWSLTEHGEVSAPTGDRVILSRRAADQLNVTPGDALTLWVELPSSVPRDSLLGERDEVLREIALTVEAVLENELGVARLEMNPSQQLPPNAFVALETLQSALDMHRHRRSRRSRVELPARVNSIFVQAASRDDSTGEQAPEAAQELTEILSKAVTLEDLRLSVERADEAGYVSLESEQLILETAVTRAADNAAARLSHSGDREVVTSPVLVYLANELVNANDADAFSMYSIVAGVELDSPSPFGPFVFVGERPRLPLGDDEIVVNDWLAEDLGVAIGERLTMKYHEVGSSGELPEQERTFKVAGVVKLEATPAADRHLTPEVEGITDADTLDEWDQPFPMNLGRVTDRDERYWEEYRATPKAFVSLQTAQTIWSSRYGDLTSFRVAKLAGRSLQETAKAVERELLNSIAPSRVGLEFQPVKYRGVQAASGTTDFSGLFFGFSFFIILAATILIGLLFRLGIDRRGASVGLLTAVGFTPRKVQWLFMAEGLLVVTVGGLLGTAAAIGYAQLMVYGLKTWWIGAIGTRYLYVFVEPMSLAVGFAISVAIMTVAVWWAMRQLRGLSARELLAGATESTISEEAQRRRGRRSWQLGLICIATSAVLVAAAAAGLVPASEAFMGLSWYVLAFFAVGITLLSGSLALLSGWLDSDRSAAVRGRGIVGMGRLGMRNAARHRQRSVLTAGLIAAATFVIVAVAAGRRNPAVELPRIDSGNGGFVLVAESSTPILYDLNTNEGRNRLDVGAEESPQAGELLANMQVMPFRVRPGEDASCLNLYQTRLPTILGVPRKMIERGGFKFANTPSDEPWTLLTEPLEGGAIPVFGDMNTLMYSLHKAVGDEIFVPDEQNPEYALQIAGMFDGAVLQGVLLMSEENFRQLYPHRVGYQSFLIGDRRIEQAARKYQLGEITRHEYEKTVAPLVAVIETKLAGMLETELAAHGFDAEPVAKRLDAFLAVQNTYLLTFQALGGLGLLLGTLGLATVMLRNVLERRAELALFRAVGFRDRSVSWLVLWENAVLLACGLIAGAASALLAMTPHLSSIGPDVPWAFTGLLLIGVFVVGMGASLLAVREALRTPVLATLRSG